MTTRLCTYDFNQMSMVMAFNRERPEDIFSWLVPEGVTGEWGFALLKPEWYEIRGSRWEKGDGTLSFFNEHPSEGAFTIDLLVTDEYIESVIKVKNNRPYTVRGITVSSCWSFHKTQKFYPDAVNRTFISLGGKLTRLSDTDRHGSLDGVMPVYAVKGNQGPEHWRERVSNGYGWGLSGDQADNAFIGIESTDGEWATGTFYKNAYRLSFNSKALWHGCIHSEPLLGTLEPGEEKEVTGRSYIIKGTINDLYERFLDLDW